MQEIEYACSTGDPVLTAFGFLNPQNLPKTVAELTNYGVQMLACFTLV
jgi:hypothetical protein